MIRELISIRSIGEFGGFFAIILGGGTGLTYFRDQFSPPISEIMSGIILVLLAMVSFWWLVKVGPESDVGRTSSLAGLGGALGVLVLDSFVSGSQYVAIGGAIGAGAFAVLGIILPRETWLKLDDELE